MIRILPRRKPKEVREVLKILNKEWVYFLQLFHEVGELKKAAESEDFRKAKGHLNRLKKVEKKEHIIAPVKNLIAAIHNMFKLHLFDSEDMMRIQGFLDKMNMLEAGILYDTIKKLVPIFDVKEKVVSKYPEVIKKAQVDWEEVKKLIEDIIDRLHVSWVLDLELREIIEEKEGTWENKLEEVKILEEIERQNVWIKLRENVGKLNARKAADMLSESYRKIGSGIFSNSKALDYYNGAIRLNPSNGAAFVERGNVFKVMGNSDKAIKDFTSAIRLQNPSHLAYQGRGICYMERKKYDDAIEDFTNAIGLDSSSFESYMDRGFCWQAKREWETAIEDFDSAINIDQRFDFIFLARANCYMELKKYGAVIRDCSIAIKINPNNSKAYNRKGMAWYMEGNNKLALEDFNQALVLDPRSTYTRKLVKFVSEGGPRIG